MITRSKFNQTLKKIFSQDLLDQARKKDQHMPNGLQVPGNPEINHIVTGVSISAELINQAMSRGADTLIVHHGLNLDSPYQLLLPAQAARLKLLFEYEMNLYGYHYVLDAHPQLGNNAQLAKALKAKTKEPYFDGWGFIAKLSKPIKLSTLSEKLKKVVDHDVFVVEAIREMKVQTLGIVSGGGVPRNKELLEIQEKQIDVHLTGEIKESSLYQFLELGVGYIAAGHYATETLGIKALTKKLQQELKGKVKVEFVEVSNPL
ncbi:MAG: Nif3-like dinuclear metal center hexameric protein [Candidatus Pacebacteria bacterium]|nr:Nif3-like dinuclear metal center hexameric protein [Candidatus Paceibacterota bacterium]